MRLLVTFDEFRNPVDTTKEVQCVLWLVELQSLTAVQCHFREQYGRQPHTRKSIRFCDKKLRTTVSLLRSNILERHGPLKKMLIASERHSNEVRANHSVLLACSYKFHVQ
jgi:hypothetical protein